MAALWSPEHKVELERRLWIAVMRAQAELGVEVGPHDTDDDRYYDAARIVARHDQLG
jgi:adenylosuccinate lyase